MKIKEKLKKIPKKWLVIASLVLFMPFLLEITGIYASGTWRYKMTVVVETPEGIKEGSAVRQVSNSAFGFDILNFPSATNPANFKGEAVVVDLGGRGHLFTILDVSPYREFYNAFRKSQSGAATVKGIRDFNRVPIGTKVILEKKNYPIMVTFENINDPKSIELVYESQWSTDKYQPYKIINNIEKVLGKGVNIKEISIERTRSHVTSKIDSVLTNNFLSKKRDWTKSMNIFERGKFTRLFNFKMERN